MGNCAEMSHFGHVDELPDSPSIQPTATRPEAIASMAASCVAGYVMQTWLQTEDVANVPFRGGPILTLGLAPLVRRSVDNVKFLCLREQMVIDSTVDAAIMRWIVGGSN